MLAAETAGWFLEHAWLIPLIPGVAFCRHHPVRQVEINGKRVASDGQAPRSASPAWSPRLVLAIGTAYQWIHHVTRCGAEAEPVIKSWTWWQIGGLRSSASASTSTAWR